jgi:hypothetical protein
MRRPIRRTLKNKTFRISTDLEARLERRATEEHTSVNHVVVQLLEQGLPRSNPFGRVRALGDRIARTRRPAHGPVPRFTKEELHEDDG